MEHGHREHGRIVLKSETYYDAIKEYGTYCIETGFIIDNENEKQIKKISEIVQENKRGVMIVGNTGSGKTILMQMLKNIAHPQDKANFIYKKAKEIVIMFDNDEIKYDVYSYYKTRNVLFDDLGTEDKGNNYGVRTECFETIIQDRYDLYKETGMVTHFTTNLGQKEIELRYGARCASRLTEMCDVVLLGAKQDYKDRRKYKNFFTLPDILHKHRPTKEDIEMREFYQKAKNNKLPPTNRTTLGDMMREKIGVDGEVKIEDAKPREKTQYELLQQDWLREFDKIKEEQGCGNMQIPIIKIGEKNYTWEQFFNYKFNLLKNT